MFPQRLVYLHKNRPKFSKSRFRKNNMWRHWETLETSIRKVLHISETANGRTDNIMAKWKRTNNDLSNTTQKTKDRATRTPLKTGGELMCFGKVSSSWSTTDTRRVTLVTNLVIRHAWGKDRIVNKESLLHAEMTKRTYRHKHHSL